MRLVPFIIQKNLSGLLVLHVQQKLGHVSLQNKDFSLKNTYPMFLVHGIFFLIQIIVSKKTYNLMQLAFGYFLRRRL
jgi:hypothetical protein